MRSRTRLLVLATCALGVLGAGAAGIASAESARPHRPQAAAQLGDAAKATSGVRERRPHRPRPTRPTTPASSAPTTPPSDPPADPSAPATPPAGPSTPPSMPPSDPGPPASSPPASTPPAPDAVIDQVLAHINAARTAEGLSTLTLSPPLTGASEAHNALMVGGCGLSHQCPGEAGLGERFTAAGVAWRSAGENIGQGNAQNNQASIVAAANGLTDLMLAEQPPNDGHRRNLLNPGFSRVGLAVTRGADGRVWFTQDFVN